MNAGWGPQRTSSEPLRGSWPRPADRATDAMRIPRPRYRLLPTGFCSIFRSYLLLALTQGLHNPFCLWGSETQSSTLSSRWALQTSLTPSCCSEKTFPITESGLHRRGNCKVPGVSLSSVTLGQGRWQMPCVEVAAVLSGPGIDLH